MEESCCIKKEMRRFCFVFVSEKISYLGQLVQEKVEIDREEDRYLVYGPL